MIISRQAQAYDVGDIKASNDTLFLPPNPG
jgi:hypothetical protein